MYGAGDRVRKRSPSPRLCYDSDDGGTIIETPVVYGIGSNNFSNRVELYRMDIVPRKMPRLLNSDSEDDGDSPRRIAYPHFRDANDDRSARHGRGQESGRPRNRQSADDDRRPRETFNPEENRQLVQIISGYLTSIQINPYNGSVPVERIQNIVRDKHADLYRRVVGTGKNTWGKFLDRNQDVFRLVVESEKKRLCLRTQSNWEEGDQLELQERQAREAHLVRCLFQFFERRGNAPCKVDDFMEGYASLPLNTSMSRPPDLPARGDFVRFVKRHSYNFMYNQKELEISLKTTAWPPPKEPH